MIRKYAEIFCWKNVSSFCSAKATHIFSAKNIRILYIESAKTVNEMTLNELVKLTMLWTTGPWCLLFDVCFPLISHLSMSTMDGKSRIIFRFILPPISKFATGARSQVTVVSSIYSPENKTIEPWIRPST